MDIPTCALVYIVLLQEDEQKPTERKILTDTFSPTVPSKEQQFVSFPLVEGCESRKQGLDPDRGLGRGLHSSRTNQSSRGDFVNNSSTLVLKIVFGSELRRDVAVLRCSEPESPEPGDLLGQTRRLTPSTLTSPLPGTHCTVLVL
ncbi:hypothetical protein AMECASPLE_019384 [Ameca splendens]|uniref:Uncharacterized protein n=1 Tax=Ameca splendens TaxID=208324 RepID=A0ABV0YEI5_9TELE